VPLAGLLTGTRVEELRLDAGHSSLVVGRTAARVTMPRIIDWLVRRSGTPAMQPEGVTA
jgi:polyhydroxyalkanoate synthase